MINKIFLACLLLPFYALAQTSLLFEENYPGNKTVFGFTVDYSIASVSIAVKFQNAFLQSKFIDNDLKDESLDMMKDENRIGSRLNAGTYFRKNSKRFWGIDSASWFVAVKERSHFNSLFPKDLFGLYFYGNKTYAGKTADVSDLNYRSVIYQQIEYGILKEKIRNEKKTGFAVSVSALNGQRYLEITTANGTLFTQSDAEYIDMNIDLKSQQSDSTKHNFGNSNGLGASACFMFYCSKENKYRLSFSATDIGFIAWNGKSNYFEVDTNYHFEGVIVNNLFDSLYLDLKGEQDFKEGFKKNREAKSFTSLLPFCFGLSYERILIPGKLTAAVSVEHILNADFIPQTSLLASWAFSKKTRGGISVQYGGYGGLNAGIYFDKDFGKGYILSLGSAYLNGYILSSSSTSQGGYASLKKVF